MARRKYLRLTRQDMKMLKFGMSGRTEEDHRRERRAMESVFQAAVDETMADPEKFGMNLSKEND